jgi:hypothetical protein
MTRTITGSQTVNSLSNQCCEQLSAADLDAFVGGAPNGTATQQAGIGKNPYNFVVIAIIAILIG